MILGQLRAKVNGRGRPRLVTPSFLLVMLATFAYFISVGVLIPVLPRFVSGPLGAGNFAVGLTVGSFALSAVLLRPWVGTWSDRRGRPVMIVIGGGLVGISVLAYVPADALVPLLLLRLFSGAGEAFFYVGAASVINDLAPDERRGEALSYFSLALFGGLAIGPAVGEFVLAATTFDTVWAVAAVFALFAGAVGLRVPETRPEGNRDARPGRIVHRAALQPGFILATTIWGLATFMTFVPLYALQMGMEGSRSVFALHAGLIILIRSLGARIPDVLGPGRSSRYAVTLVMVAMVTIGLWSEPVGLYAGTALFALGQALAFPALMTLAIRGAPASERGSVVGTFTAFFDGAFGIGAISAGGIAAVLGYEGAFVAAGAVAGTGLGLLVFRKVAAVRARRAATT